MVSIGVPPYTHINLGHGTCSVHSLEISTSQQPTSVEITFLCNSCIVSSMIFGWPTLVLSPSYSKVSFMEKYPYFRGVL